MRKAPLQSRVNPRMSMRIEGPKTAKERRNVLARALRVAATLVREQELDPRELVLRSDRAGNWEITIDGQKRFAMQHPDYFMGRGSALL
jgi:hypothetical protein